MSELRRFRNELSVNHVTDGEYTPEARTYMSGAADGGAKHIGKSLAPSASQIVKGSAVRGSEKQVNGKTGIKKIEARPQ